MGMRKSILTPRLVRRSLISVVVACAALAAAASVATAVPTERSQGAAPGGEAVTYVTLPQDVQGAVAAPTGELAVTGSSDETPWLALGGVLAILVGMVMTGLTLRPEPVLVEMRTLRPIRPVDPRRRRTQAPDWSIST
jgi:hypothetical protein